MFPSYVIKKLHVGRSLGTRLIPKIKNSKIAQNSCMRHDVTYKTREGMSIKEKLED